jgi:hypothetical protein
MCFGYQLEVVVKIWQMGAIFFTKILSSLDYVSVEIIFFGSKNEKIPSPLPPQNFPLSLKYN